MKLVSQLSSILTPYLPKGANTGATTVTDCLNFVLPRIYQSGDWKALRARMEVNVASGYFCLDPEWESVLTASLLSVPIAINDINYQTRRGGPGEITRPASGAFGLLDMGFTTLMSEIASTGADEFIFTSETNATFASGNTVTITYTDTDDGYTQVVLPLNTISTTISAADTYASGAETKLTVVSSTGYVVGAGVTISNASSGDEDYNGDWRVTAVVDATHIAINKTWDGDTAVTADIASNRKLIPASTIASVEQMSYENMPSRVTVTDADGIQYAVLTRGDGVTQFRRYNVVQAPVDPSNPEDWNVIAVVKRAFTPITSTSDPVYIDNINVLTEAFLSVVARDAEDLERAVLS